MSMQVRDVERGDADDLGALHVAAWLGAYRNVMSDEFLERLDAEASRARWRQWLGGQELPSVRVAVRDGALLGFCILAMPTRDVDAGVGVAEIAALNVLPEAWRTGVGSALMRDALGRLRSDGWQLVTLWVADGNERAISFYRRFGFEFDGATKAHEASGASERRMQLSLRDH